MRPIRGRVNFREFWKCCMCGLGSMSRSGLGLTRRGGVVGCVGVDACSVGRHQRSSLVGMHWAGRVVMRCVGMTRM